MPKKDEVILHGPPMARVPDEVDNIDDTLSKLYESHDMDDIQIPEEDLAFMEEMTLKRKHTAEEVEKVEALWSKYMDNIVVANN